MKIIIFVALGIVLAFVLIVLLIYLFIRTMLNKAGFGSYSLSKIFSEIRESREREEKRHKQVSGMTSVLLPRILEEFPSFNEREFYSATESNIRNILNAVEDKNIELLKSDDYDLIREKIFYQIHDLNDNNISYNYDDIEFHKHAIKSFTKMDGMIKLEISSSLEYYYSKMKDGKKITSSKVKKQTRYTTTYVYIYDNKKAGFDINVLGLNCPNCGSPIPSIDTGVCPYCKSGFNITVAKLLKCWKIVDTKEDY